MRAIIIIPAFNPPSQFYKLLNRINYIYDIPIIVIDDGSNISININNHTIQKLITNKINEGKGAALLQGFKYAKAKGFTHAITMDADFQHDPNLIPLFLAYDEKITIVSGKRTFDRTMPFHRRLSNIITTNIISFICKQKVLDSQCGYRRYILGDVLDGTYVENGFQFESEVLIKLLRKGNTISHIDIPTIYNNANSAIKNIQDTFKFIRLIIRNILNIL